MSIGIVIDSLIYLQAYTDVQTHTQFGHINKISRAQNAMKVAK